MNNPSRTIPQTSASDNDTPRSADYRPKNNSITPDIVKAFADGDHAAFQKIFLAYYNNISSFVNALVKSEAESEEISQELFVNLWQNRAKVDGLKNFNGYIYTLARNAVYDYFRRKLVRDSYASDKWHTEETEDSEDILVAKELELLIDMTIDNMPRQRKKIFEMSRKEGVSNEEIARRLGITKGAVERQLTLALKDIRQVIAAFIVLFLS